MNTIPHRTTRWTLGRIDTFKLRKRIPAEEFDYVLLRSVLSPYAGLRQKIHYLLKHQIIIRVKKGLYVFGPEYNLAPICKEVLANLIYGPSSISLEYALAFYGLIPERVETITSITPKREKTFNTPVGRFTYSHLALEKYSLGIQQVWLDDRHPVLMATIEKALCDYLVLKKVPHFDQLDEAQNFLEKDLRINPDDWARFNLTQMRQLNRVYCNKTISQLINMLSLRKKR